MRDKMAKKAKEKTAKVKKEEVVEIKEEIAEEILQPEKIEAEVEVIAAADEVEVPAPLESTDKSRWTPKTSLGKRVKNGLVADVSIILDNGEPILETEIVDTLIPDLKTDLLLIGQSKGKFGGGQRRVFKQTQKKTQEGNKPNFSTMAVVGNEDGIVGIGMGKAKETVPAREKSLKTAKKNLIKIRRGCGSWQCNCKAPHSIPFKIQGKVGSTEITLIPAPKGTGLVIQSECAKVLTLAGVKDIWSMTRGVTRSRHNLIQACFEALRKLSQTKIKHGHVEMLGIREGSNKKSVDEKFNKEFIEAIKSVEE